MHDRARGLRKIATDAEQLLWRHLRSRQLDGHKFRRQQPLGRFIVDFVCLEKRLVVELDGGHHNEPRQQMYDLQRSEWLKERGFRVIRFWDDEVLKQIDEVKAVIANALAAS
jgi:very-short-patch-repair endonuclease